jgi:hypothetical protein
VKKQQLETLPKMQAGQGSQPISKEKPASIKTFPGVIHRFCGQVSSCVGRGKVAAKTGISGRTE